MHVLRKIETSNLFFKSWTWCVFRVFQVAEEKSTFWRDSLHEGQKSRRKAPHDFHQISENPHLLHANIPRSFHLEQPGFGLVRIHMPKSGRDSSGLIPNSGFEVGEEQLRLVFLFLAMLHRIAAQLLIEQHREDRSCSSFILSNTPQISCGIDQFPSPFALCFIAPRSVTRPHQTRIESIKRSVFVCIFFLNWIDL